MTKSELEARLTDALYALENAERAFKKMHATLSNVNFHPDAPTNESPAHAIGALRADIWFANSGVCSALGYENTLSLVG